MDILIILLFIALWMGTAVLMWRIEDKQFRATRNQITREARNDAEARR